MRKLHVIYDSQCGFCTKCRWWLLDQLKYVEIEFWAKGSAPALRKFPHIGEVAGHDDLVVVGNDGRVWKGPDAFIMCLWALKEYRELSLRLSNPILKPLARRAFGVLSGSRRLISKVFGLRSDAEIAESLRSRGPAVCDPDLS